MKLAARLFVLAFVFVAAGCGATISFDAPGTAVPSVGALVASARVPSDVRETLERYVAVLRSAENLQDCTASFTPLAGALLVNEDGSLRTTVPQFSLKKDFQNVKFYADPVRITRVDVHENRSSGFGATALCGTEYKIWIDRVDRRTGMPAPITILAPEGHPTIHEPRVTGIGSL